MTVLSDAGAAAGPVRPDPPPSMVERMTLIMDAFTGATARLTLEEVTRSTHLPRSTAHRILDQLVRLQWLDHSAFGYGLGRRALGLAGRRGGHDEIREAAAPLLHDLQIKTGLVVHLAILEGASVFYLDKVGGRSAASVPSRVGGRAPAQSTALGRAILAWLPPEQVDARVGAGGAIDAIDAIDAIGDLGDLGELGALHQELHRIRRRHGVAFERGECFPRIACVAAAVRGHEGPVAAISVAGEVGAPLEEVAPLVAGAARGASRTLFPHPADPRRARSPMPGRPWPAELMNRFLNGDRM